MGIYGNMTKANAAEHSVVPDSESPSSDDQLTKMSADSLKELEVTLAELNKSIEATINTPSSSSLRSDSKEEPQSHFTISNSPTRKSNKKDGETEF